MSPKFPSICGCGPVEVEEDNKRIMEEDNKRISSNKKG